jgi:peptide/nickel transport system substrate-binding protein
VAQTAAEAASPSGGEAIVLLGADFAGSWPAGLDPATNYTGGANISQMNAIFGGLFQLTADEDGANPRLVGVLATGYEVTDEGRTIVIRLREGVRFSDGTPLNAEAVKFSIDRSLDSSCACSPKNWPWEKTNPVTTPDEHTVALHFTTPYAPVMNGFPVSNINWPVSPTALREMGEEKFKIAPVGAGPFRVVSNQLSSRLVLERNPTYWQRGRPYLDRLVFQSIGSEQAAYQALRAADAHAYEGMSSIPLIRAAQENKELTVTTQPAVSSMVVQLNTTVAPFNDKRAREAIYYATNTAAIRTGLFKDSYPTSQSFTGPGGLFHRASVPGYRTFDPRKAQALVKELGGLRIRLGTLRTQLSEQTITALQSQWQEAGIEVTLEVNDLGTLVRQFQSGDWQAMLQFTGSYDPEAGTGVRARFKSNSVFSGVRDSQLDDLLRRASETMESQERDELYAQAAKYISDEAYAPFLVATAPVQLARFVQAPGLTTKIPPILLNTSVLWQDARLTSH